MNSIMFDIETLGTSAGDIILSLGACAYDKYKSFEEGKNKENVFYSVLNFSESKKDNFKSKLDTYNWWQAPSRQQHYNELVNSKVALSNRDILISFNSWIDSIKVKSKEQLSFWSYGHMDCDMLKFYYEKYYVTFPIHYRSWRDLRTFIMEFPNEEVRQKCWPNGDNDHNALNDSINQAGAHTKVSTIQKIIVDGALGIDGNTIPLSVRKGKWGQK